MIRTMTLAAAAAALVGATAIAQDSTRKAAVGAQDSTRRAAVGAQDSTRKAAVSDGLFAQAAASGGLAEVAISELGVQKATNPELKKFSQQMIDEHTRMNQQLMTLAAQKQLPLPRQPDVRAQFCAQSLAGLSGEEFDHCYAKAQLMAHKDSVATFEAEAERGQDPQVRALASQALPRIKEHLKMLEPIAKKCIKE
jgi:putative membrane protein